MFRKLLNLISWLFQLKQKKDRVILQEKKYIKENTQDAWRKF